MRALLWLLTLCALAAGVALAAQYNDGYLLLVLPPYRAEISLNLALLLLLAVFVVVYGLLRGIALTASLPRRVREFRARKQREKADAALFECVRLLLEGRYAQVLKLAGEAHAAHRHPGLIALIAARAAQRLGEPAKQNDWLARARQGEANLKPASYLLEAEMHLAANDGPAALTALAQAQEGAGRHFAELLLALRAHRLCGDHDEVLRLSRLLEKHAALPADEAARVRQAAHLGRLAELSAPSALADARAALRARVDSIPDGEFDAPVAAAAARALAACGETNAARRCLEAQLARAWDGELVRLYGELPGDPAPRIACAEAWLATHGEDADLLLALGRMCLAARLWGPAQGYLEAALTRADTRVVRLALAQLCEATGQPDAALPHYRAAAERPS